jgi:choline transporter-like protein 2/4/5
VQFLVYFTFTVVAGAIACWYFTPRDAKGEKVRGEGEGQLSHFPVLGAFYRTVRFHLGTIALASLIIAVIEFIRLVVKYVEEMSTPKHGPANRLQKAVFCLLQCCLACVQCCLDKISKNALVWCAIYGDNFAESACASFALVWANLARVAALSLVSAFILLVGKLLVAFLTTGLAAISIFHYYGDQELSSLVLPVVVIFLLSYLVAALFMATLDTTAATVFLCFLVDEKYNKQSGCMLASPGLQAVIDAHRETGAEYATREQQKAAYRQTGQTDGAAQPQQLSSGSQAVVPNHTQAAAAGNHPHSAMQLSSAPSSMV